MKNIHILPTDKPSRLSILGSGKLDFGLEFISSSNSKAQYIYITSDEEIKEKRLRFIMDNREGMCGLIHQVSVVLDSKICPEIILTTDQDLIKDGVQAIDDNFLEWFVKNPSCERVKIERGKLQIDDDGQEYGFPDMSKYKIIIPKEEQKQDYSGVHLRHCYQGEYEDGCKYGEDDCPAKPLEKPKQLTDLEIAIKMEEIEREEYQQELHICKYCGAETTQPDDECYMLRLKQETLEGASEKYARAMWGPYYNEVYPDEPAITLTLGEISVKDFSRGAKWQAKRMYSKEDMIEFTQTMIMQYKFGNTNIEQLDLLKESLEQYKKK